VSIQVTLLEPHPRVPLELAPALVGRLERLLQEVTITRAPDLVVEVAYAGPRCVVCHAGGKLGGHHPDDGQIEWIHRACHRRLHRRGRVRAPGAARQRRLERRRTPC